MAADLDRAEISRRLKAARWLAGATDENGKPAPLAVRDLAQRAPLAENRISANRIEEFEQLVSTPRPMELEKITEALGLPEDWFFAPPLTDGELRRLTELLGSGILEAARALEQERERSGRDAAGPGRRGEAGGAPK